MAAVSIDPASSIPASEQVRAAFAEQIGNGQLAGGAKLPTTVRALADELSLAANTVAKAYRELEADGFIETRGRNGSFVSAQGDVAEREAQLAAQAYVERVLRLGLDAAAARRFIDAALRDRS
jgi:DNA-binding transcriptional regulator YhcF (GntR family)